MRSPAPRHLEPAGPRSAGFSLIELLIASSILVGVVVTSLRAHVGARDGLEGAAERQSATRALRSARAILHAADPLDVVDATGNLIPGSPLNVATALENGTVSYALVAPAAPPRGAPIPLRITCTWTDARGRNRSLELLDAVR